MMIKAVAVALLLSGTAVAGQLTPSGSPARIHDFTEFAYMYIAITVIYAVIATLFYAPRSGLGLGFLLVLWGGLMIFITGLAYSTGDLAFVFA